MYRLLTTAAALILCTLATATAQTQSVTQQTPSNSLTFATEPAQVGQRVTQSIEARFELTSRARRGNTILQQSKNVATSNQERDIVTTAVEQGTRTAATVHYQLAKKELESDNKQVGGPQQEAVSGKTYHCLRDGEKLVITTSEGAIPTVEEYNFIAKHMDTLGRPNPLAQFLTGKQVTVGQKLTLPNEVAAELLGFDESLGSVTSFDLALEAVEVHNGSRCGVFRSEIQLSSSDGSQMKMIVDGRLTIDAITCRAVSAKFSGPLGMTERQGDVQVDGVGNLRVAIKSQYDTVR